MANSKKSFTEHLHLWLLPLVEFPNRNNENIQIHVDSLTILI